ncbi:MULTISPECIES: ABC transporter substrate-binding protein [Jonquetella]|uniref:ABC-type dipeptide transport system, periplasmic component n=1 Tax=Jonquetella anthropi DSM 22815 TaxID=885272 RepID=H0UKW9_9BACT|nr:MULTISPECIES: ABC transporter substrate-binding protein [Jonquetella]EHM13328.1 ABC-type dipeptide transport system, periplasmic component [Jonquetella anthropi DSM 22815]ERL23551.1 ABC transporter, substrate-binding protein, family 5 [Jonquetella sp. BV3C21]
MIKKLMLSVALAAFLAPAAFAHNEPDTLIVANSTDIKTLDPMLTGDAGSAQTFLCIYDHLLWQDLEGNLVPRLAESWETPDPLTYILHLRKGVWFHNGEPFTAEDAKYTIDRGRTTVTATGANVLLNDIKDVEIKDDYTIVIHMKKPFTPLLYAFTEVWGSVVNKKTMEALGDKYVEHPVGTGPFKFVSWRKGDRVVLERNDDYWGDKADFKTLIIRAVPESSVRTIELESGSVDMIFKVNVNDINRIADNPNLKLLRRKDLREDFFVLNCSKPPFNDVRVRQAFSKALDVAGIQKAVYRGVGYAPKGPLPQGMVYYDDTLPEHDYDVEGAEALLKEAGVKDLHVTIKVNESKERVDAATIAQAMLGEVGITADIQVLEYGALLDCLTRGDFEISMSGWGNNLPDPEFALGRLYHSRGIGATNDARFNDPKFDELLDKGASTPEGPERAEVYKEVQRYFLDKVPALYWYGGEQVTGISRRIAEFPLHRRGIYEFNKVKLAK